MDDRSIVEADGTKEEAAKTARKKRSPSPDRGDKKSRRRSRSESSKSRSRSVSPRRRRRSRSRGYSPDRRRFNRGGYQRDYRRGRRSPSPPYRGRNRARRSRSSSYEYRNRRASNDRSVSHDSKPNNRDAPPLIPQPAQNYPPADYYPAPAAGPNMAAPFPAQQPPYPGYEFQVMQPHAAPFPPFANNQPPAHPLWNHIPPPPTLDEEVPKAKVVAESDEDKQKREAGVALEKERQRESLLRQRDDYQRRVTALKRELKVLQDQRVDLTSGDEPPSPTTNRFIDENRRLQDQITNKIETIENVIDMLGGLIKLDKRTPEKVKDEPKASTVEPAAGRDAARGKDIRSEDSSPERLKTKVIESMARKRKDSDRHSNKTDEKSSKRVADHVNFTFFDPEQHWCKICSAFPKTAKEYLIHLHSEEHKNNAKPPEIPWHDHIVSDEMPTYPNAATKRTPIRGLQFFMPSTAWYCKLCAFWIGDLHCASAHLKSRTHAAKYDEFVEKNPAFESDWLRERGAALDAPKQKAPAPKLAAEPKKENPIAAPPPPPPVLQKPQNAVSSAAPLPFAPTALFDGIPLKIGQRTKDNSVSEDSQKKSKKRKKDKKKRKKSKKKHHRRSSTSSSSSSSSDEESSDSASPTPEHHSSPEKPAPDTSASIRVAMRNVAAPPKEPDAKPANGGSSNTGGWTVVQEPKVVAPQPPTISANGEAQNRRDEMMISQWNTPVQPVISEQEKQLLVQLKDKLKSRDEAKKEKTPPPIVVAEVKPTPPKRDEKAKDSAAGTVSKRDDDDKRRTDKDRDKDRRDTYRRRRSRSRSISSPKRDRRVSRSPRRDRRRKSRSYSPRRDRRVSRSPRRDRRRRSRSRSKSRDRRSERNDGKNDKANNDKDADRKAADNSKSGTTAKKPSSTASSNKKLPFIGRMPVFKKQSTEEEPKKVEPSVNEEEKLKEQRKRDELKMQIQQKQQLLQHQQKQAEAYNLAHPGQIASFYSSHGTVHHGLQPHAEYEQMMTDSMGYATMMVPPPPPSEQPPQPVQPTPAHHYAGVENVLPPGIEEEEVHKVEAAPAAADSSENGALPKDFQDALSIIFDKGAEKVTDNVQPPANEAGSASVSPPTGADAEGDDAYANMDVDDSSNGALASANMELDEHTQYQMMYGTMDYAAPAIATAAAIPDAYPAYAEASTEPTAQLAEMSAADVQPGDACDTTTGPGPVLGGAAEYLAAVITDEKSIPLPDEIVGDGLANEQAADSNEADLEAKARSQELDDMAMLGIDVEDMAAQCF